MSICFTYTAAAFDLNKKPKLA